MQVQKEFILQAKSCCLDDIPCLRKAIMAQSQYPCIAKKEDESDLGKIVGSFQNPQK